MVSDGKGGGKLDTIRVDVRHQCLIFDQLHWEALAGATAWTEVLSF